MSHRSASVRATPDSQPIRCSSGNATADALGVTYSALLFNMSLPWRRFC